MKVRLRGQSIRFRLSRGEVADLAAGRAVVNRTTLTPDHSLAFALQPDRTATTVKSVLDGGLLTFALPTRQVAELAGTEAVGFSTHLIINDGVSLRVLIEKDFQCLDHPAGEPQDDAYPNPSVVCLPDTGAPAREL